MAKSVQVKMWQSIDGRRWETCREADRADCEERVRRLVEHNAFNDMTKDDITNMLLDNQEDFRQALDPKAPVAEES